MHDFYSKRKQMLIILSCNFNVIFFQYLNKFYKYYYVSIKINAILLFFKLVNNLAVHYLIKFVLSFSLLYYIFL